MRQKLQLMGLKIKFLDFCVAKPCFRPPRCGARCSVAGGLLSGLIKVFNMAFPNHFPLIFCSAVFLGACTGNDGIYDLSPENTTVNNPETSGAGGASSEGVDESGSTVGSNTDGAAGSLVKPVSYADPHLITLDGLTYSLHAVGEFVLAQSELGNFIVQARQRQTGQSNASVGLLLSPQVNSNVSVNSGFAFKVGNDVVAVAFNASDDLQVFVNKEDRTQQGDITLPDGGQLNVATDTITINWQDGSKAVIYIYSSFLNLSLFVADVHKGKLSGLLGNYDGDTNNDMRTSLGVDISTTPQTDQFYGSFTEGWRVTDETSLFVYSGNETTASFTDRLLPGLRFTAEELNASDRATAIVICDNAGVTDVRLRDHCILDVGATDDVEFADAIMQVQNDLGDRAASIVELELTGQLEIPDFTCSNQLLVDANGLPVSDVSGVFNGTLTNPTLPIGTVTDPTLLDGTLGDVGLLGTVIWDTRLEFEQCGSRVNGLLNLSSAGLTSYRRRFEGVWREGQLMLNFGLPSSIADGQVPCTDMAAQLTGNANMLQGNWTSTNCTAGGEISVVGE